MIMIMVMMVDDDGDDDDDDDDDAGTVPCGTAFVDGDKHDDDDDDEGFFHDDAPHAIAFDASCAVCSRKKGPCPADPEGFTAAAGQGPRAAAQVTLSAQKKRGSLAAPPDPTQQQRVRW